MGEHQYRWELVLDDGKRKIAWAPTKDAVILKAKRNGFNMTFAKRGRRSAVPS